MFMVSVVHRKLQMKYIKQKCEGKSKSYEFNYASSSFHGIFERDKKEI